MNWLRQLLFSFEGRIGQQDYWAGQGVLLLARMLLMTAVLVSGAQIIHKPIMPTDPIVIAGTLLSLLEAYPNFAMITKRLRDLNRPIWWAWVFIGSNVIPTVINPGQFFAGGRIQFGVANALLVLWLVGSLWLGLARSRSNETQRREDRWRVTGRIGRLQFWRGTSAAFGMIHLFQMAVSRIPVTVLAIWLYDGDTTRSTLMVLGALTYFSALGGDIVMRMCLALMLIALTIQLLWFAVPRLHDRGKSAWRLVFYLVVPPTLALAPRSLLPTSAEPGGFTPVYLLWLALATLGLVVALWAFVELGFLPGTPGANRYGPDPLAPPTAA